MPEQQTVEERMRMGRGMLAYKARTQTQTDASCLPAQVSSGRCEMLSAASNEPADALGTPLGGAAPELQ